MVGSCAEFWRMRPLQVDPVDICLLGLAFRGQRVEQDPKLCYLRDSGTRQWVWHCCSPCSSLDPASQWSGQSESVTMNWFQWKSISIRHVADFMLFVLVSKNISEGSRNDSILIRVDFGQNLKSVLIPSPCIPLSLFPVPVPLFLFPLPFLVSTVTTDSLD